MDSNRVASFTSATCSLRFGEALINLVPQVGEFLLHGPFAKQKILAQIHDLEACIQMYMIYIPTGAQPSVWIGPLANRDIHSMFFWSSGKERIKKVPFFLGGVAKQKYWGVIKVIGNSNPAC